MKHLKMLGFAAFAVMALMGIGAGTASATTLSKEGANQIGAIEIKATLEAGSSAILQKTDGTFANTCLASEVRGSTVSPFTTAKSEPIGGPVTVLSFTQCSEPVTVDKPGSLSIEWIKGTTNGTVKSTGAEVTVPSPFGNLNCKTGTGTDIGTLTGKATGSATMDIHAVLNCGILASSATWDGSYSVTSPAGLGVEE